MAPLKRLVAASLLLASPAFASDEEVLAPNDKVLVAAVCTAASIPGPQHLPGQVELGALRGEGKPAKPAQRKPAVLPPTFGWVSITTDEKSLRGSAEQYARDLTAALRVRREERYPAPCVTDSAMDQVVITAIVRTEKGYLGIAAVDATVRTLPAPEPDEKKALRATMKLASELAGAELTPALVKNLHGKSLRSGSLSRDWAQTP